MNTFLKTIFLSLLFQYQHQYNVKVMTWNVEGRFYKRKNLNCQSFAQEMGNILKQNQEDVDLYILAIQEVIESKFQTLLANDQHFQTNFNLLNLKNIIAPSQDQVQIDQFIAIFQGFLQNALGNYNCLPQFSERKNTFITFVCIKSSIQLLEDPKVILKHLEVSSLIEQNYSVFKNFDFLKSKGGIATEIKLPDLDIYVLNVHLDAYVMTIKINQIKQLIQKLFVYMNQVGALDNLDRPFVIILAGDYNTRTGGKNEPTEISNAFNEYIKDKKWTDQLFEMDSNSNRQYQGKISENLNKNITDYKKGISLRQFESLLYATQSKIRQQNDQDILKAVLENDLWLNMFQVNREDNLLDALLRQNDQNRNANDDQYFSQINEGTINFIPTYTYENKLTEEQIQSQNVVLSQKQRPLSYADRIFWATSGTRFTKQLEDIQQYYYKAGHSSLVQSDHLYVQTLLKINVQKDNVRIIQFQIFKQYFNF